MRKRKVDGAQDLDRSSRLIGKRNKCIAIYLNFHSLVLLHHWGFFLKTWHHLQDRWSCTGHTCSDLSLGDAPSSSSSGRGTCQHVGMTWGERAVLRSLGSQRGEEWDRAEQGASREWARSKLPHRALRAGCSWASSFFTRCTGRCLLKNTLGFFLLLSHLSAVVSKSLTEEKINCTIFVLK